MWLGISLDAKAEAANMKAIAAKWEAEVAKAEAEAVKAEPEAVKAEAEAAKAAKAEKAEAEVVKKNARCELSHMITQEWEHFGLPWRSLEDTEKQAIVCDILREMVKVYCENFNYMFDSVDSSGERTFTLEESNSRALATCAFLLKHQDPCNWYTTLPERDSCDWETESQAMFDRQTPSNKGTKRGNSGRKGGKGAKRGKGTKRGNSGRKKVAPPKA